MKEINRMKICFFLLLSVIGIQLQAQQVGPRKSHETIVKLKNCDIVVRASTVQAFKRCSSISSRGLKPLGVKKVGGVLKLKLRKGGYVTLKDITGHETEEKTHHLKGILRNLFYVVLVNYYESGEYLLINKQDGAIVKLWGEPLVSRDGSYVASFSGSLDYDIMPNGIQVYNIGSKKMSVLWEYTIDNWQPEAITWKDNRTLLALKVVPSRYSQTGKKSRTYLEIGF